MVQSHADASSYCGLRGQTVTQAPRRCLTCCPPVVGSPAVAKKEFVVSCYRTVNGRASGGDCETTSAVHCSLCGRDSIHGLKTDARASPCATAVDYDAKGELAKLFLLWAISGRTAAELVAERASAARPNIGLTSWKGGRARQQDVAGEEVRAFVPAPLRPTRPLEPASGTGQRRC
jgi:hypothetical protein